MAAKLITSLPAVLRGADGKWGASGLAPARHQTVLRLAEALLARVLEGSTAHRRERIMYKESKTYLTAAVTALVVAILFSLAAIFVRSVVAMDGKITADGAVLELRKSLP